LPMAKIHLPSREGIMCVYKIYWNIYRTFMSVKFAKTLRKNMTPWEIRLWGRLRRGNFGVRFHRQEPIGKYVADFCCRQIWLIIELDGEHHKYNENDKIREEYLQNLGFKIIRFTNHEIQWNLNDVGNSIEAVVGERINNFTKSARRGNYF